MSIPCRVLREQLRRVDYWTMAFWIIGALGLVVGLAVGTLAGWILRAVAKEKGW